MSTPVETFHALLRADAARPRITVYDDTDGPSRGERIELSARVLGNWVAKAANALQDEWDLGPGSLVGLDLPPHWRSLYWSLAVWSVGATVVLDPLDTDDLDLLVTASPEVAADAAAPAVLVTLPALTRSGTAPAGSWDEARELASHPDQFEPYAVPRPTDLALRSATGSTAYGEFDPASSTTGARVHTGTEDLTEFLDIVLAAWAAGGSVVLSRGTPEPDVLAARLAAEGVTGEAR